MQLAAGQASELSVESDARRLDVCLVTGDDGMNPFMVQSS
jgi:hypothetical protein